jgi:hypothetical protein
MNDRSDIERVLRYWLEDGPAAMPDRVVDVVARRISVRPQRRSRRLLRRSPMRPAFKYGIAAAAVLIVAVVGYALLPRTGSIGAPAPTVTKEPTATPATLGPTTVPNPTAAAVVCDSGTRGCLGMLTGGTYSSANFKPTLTYTVPSGPTDGPPAAHWTNSVDLSRTYSLVPPGGGYTFQAISEIAIPEQTPDCSAKVKAGAGTKVVDWLDFLTKHPGLQAQTPVAVTIGGFSGFTVRFARAASWTATCPGSIGPAVELYVHPGAPQAGVRFVDDQEEAYTLLDVNGETVLIVVESGSATAQAADLASAEPIIDTFAFTPR